MSTPSNKKLPGGFLEAFNWATPNRSTGVEANLPVCYLGVFIGIFERNLMFRLFGSPPNYRIKLLISHDIAARQWDGSRHSSLVR